MSTTAKNAYNTISDPRNFIMIALVGMVIVLLFVGLTVLGIYLHSRSESALIQSTKMIGDGQKLNFGSSWKLGKKRLSTLFWQNIIMNLPVYLIFIASAFAIIEMLPTFTTAGFSVASQLYLAITFGCLVCLVLIYMLIVGVVLTMGKPITVLEDVGAIEGIKRGFHFIKNNISDVIIFWLISWIISIVVGIIGFVVGAIIVVGIIAMVVSMIFSPLVIIVIVAIAAVIALGISCMVLAYFQGMTYSLYQMYWTNVYLAIKAKKS